MPVSMLSTSLFSDRKSYSRFNALDTIYTPPVELKPGMVLVSPTSITHSGTSATLGANGQVTFSAVTSLSLNGVFTAEFDNYVISIRDLASDNNVLYFRLRASGSDATGSDYDFQYLFASSTTEGTMEGTGQDKTMLYYFNNGSLRDGATIDIYGPALAANTSLRSVAANTFGQVRIDEAGASHGLSTSYDGFTLIPNAANMTGALTVYGIRS